ncbi:hypothetical protein BC938DRAFT_479499 [Jimgerdemannia flammicorona]|uniref:Uncharacterized protein n=1 Tax=Jimgerdemannia flammicorona TaxID=994334 RepID=A0A433QKQ9_9FUNG|nr:hypothetical protein BC938DRAFT_479499 [Jimgerdemannia flammicorona]
MRNVLDLYREKSMVSTEHGEPANQDEELAEGGLTDEGDEHVYFEDEEDEVTFEVKSFGTDHCSRRYTDYTEYFGYYEGQAVDPALFLGENNEESDMGTHFYQPFDHGAWEKLTLKLVRKS